MWNGGLSLPARLLKKSLVSSALLRRNSNTVPWYSLVPERVETLTTPPEKRPHSAERLLLSTLNSWVESTEGMVVIELNSPAVVGTPSIITSALCACPPLIAKSLSWLVFTETSPNWPPAAGVFVTPGVISTSRKGLRPFNGMFRILALSITCPSDEVCSASSGAAATTSTASVSAPNSIAKSRRITSSTWSVNPARVNVLNPAPAAETR